MPSWRYGEKNHNWMGGRYIDQQGYVVLKFAGTRIREHRFVMQKHLGRPLKRTEVVHHKNGDRSDNRLENLELVVSHSEHMRQHSGGERSRRMQLLAAKAKWSVPTAKQAQMLLAINRLGGRARILDIRRIFDFSIPEKSGSVLSCPKQGLCKAKSAEDR